MTEKLSAGVYTSSQHTLLQSTVAAGKTPQLDGRLGPGDQHAAVVPDTAAARTLMKLPVLMRRIKVMFVVRWVK